MQLHIKNYHFRSMWWKLLFFNKESFSSNLKFFISGTTEIVDLHTSLKELRHQEVNFDSETKQFRQKLESEKKKVAAYVIMFD